MEGEVLSQSSSRREMEDQQELLSDKVSSIEEKMKHLFPSFRDWSLVEEITTTGLPSYRCRLCREYVLVPYYTAKEEGGGEESKPVGHKVCCDLPMEIEHHQLHPGHTLRKTKALMPHMPSWTWYCYYKCSDCEDFLLDIKCALKFFPINHICHPQHPLVPNHESDKEFYCDACSMVHKDGISYECSTCPSFRVHQYCVSPRIVKLPSHRHDVRFVYSIPETQFGQPIYCHICRQHLKGQTLAYHCARCRYYFHINCRSIQHSSVHDPLVLVEEEGAHALPESAKCSFCLMKISVPYYVTTGRYTDHVPVHKLCAELPDRVQHYLHPEHDLTLGYYGRICHDCDAPWEGFSYSCVYGSCGFSLDIICALKNIYSRHEFHKHPLITSHSKGPLACRACNIDSDGPSYQCTTCRYWVHQQCGSAPLSRKHDTHPHLLKLTYSIRKSAPEDHRTFRCQVCREEMQPDDWAYHCSGCKYYIHAHDCYPPWSRETEEFNHEEALAAAVPLPAVDSESVSLATLFFMDTDADAIRIGKPLFLDPIEACHRCAELLAPPCNNCALCNYFLPKSVSEFNDPESLLRRYNSMLKDDTTNETICNGFAMDFWGEDKVVIKIKVWPHRHFLSSTFITKPTRCSLCERDAVGDAFRCNLCNFTLDTRCGNCYSISFKYRYDKKLQMKISSSVLPRYVKHEGHQHVLLTTFITRPTWCSACEGDVQGYAFRCNLCNFTIDTYCATLPGSIKHRYDKKHPFKLTYYYIEGVEEYVCELCEKDITTMWFYHCVDCDHSIHPRCIWRYFIYFGPSICSNYDGKEKLLVPTTETHPARCSTCGEEETTRCRYSAFVCAGSDRKIEMTHLECEDGGLRYMRWPREREWLVDELDCLKSEEDESKSPDSC